MYVPSTATASQARQSLASLDKSILSLDLETNKLEPSEGSILLLGLRDKHGRTVIIHGAAVHHVVHELSHDLGKALVVGANLGFDHKWMLHHHGIRLRRVFDVRWAHKGLTCGLPEFEQDRLDEIAKYWLRRPMNKDIRQQFIDVDATGWETTDEQLEYLTDDLDVPLELMNTMLPRIKELGLVEALKLRFGMVPVAGELELYGAPVNIESYQQDIERAKSLRAIVERNVIEQLTPPVLKWRVKVHDQRFKVWKAWKQEYDAAKAQHETAVDTVDGLRTLWNTKRERRDLINEANRRWKEAHKEPPKPKLESGPINLNSGHQLLGALQVLGYKFNSTKHQEFEEYLEVLEETGDTDEMLQPLLIYKRLQKIVAAFGDGIIERMRPFSRVCPLLAYGTQEGLREARESAGVHGTLHPSVNLMVTTGRMSQSGPNLQQVPNAIDIDPDDETMKALLEIMGVPEGIHLDLRRNFEAPPGHHIGVLDLANIEMRIEADQSGDPQMIVDFVNNADMHTRTTATGLHITYDEGMRLKDAHDAAFTKARKGGKIKNFATLYGAWDQEHIKVFSSTYPTMWAHLQANGESAVREGLSRGADGFIKFWILPPQPPKWEKEAYKEWRKLHNRIVRQGKNMPIQTTSAAVIFAAAIAVHWYLIEHYPGLARLFNIVHDELDLLIKGSREFAEKVMAEVKAIAERAGQRFLTQVPVVAEGGIGKSWADAK